MESTGMQDREKNFSLNARLKSFKNAFAGLKTLIVFEHNARIHLLILITVICLGIIFRISSTDWIAIVLAAGMVIASECFNTAVEYLSDAVIHQQNEKIKHAKDVAAAGVLISAIISVIIGIFVFLPEIKSFITENLFQK